MWVEYSNKFRKNSLTTVGEYTSLRYDLAIYFDGWVMLRVEGPDPCAACGAHYFGQAARDQVILSMPTSDDDALDTIIKTACMVVVRHEEQYVKRVKERHLDNGGSTRIANALSQ